MDPLQSSLRINDIYRLLNILESDVMGTHYRATLPTGKLINLAVAIQGQNIIRLPALESIAQKEIGVNPLELKKVYLPVLQEWGFVRIFEKKIEENIPSRSSLLQKCVKFWEDCDPHPVEELSLDLFDKTALAPVEHSKIRNLFDAHDITVERSAWSHLNAVRLVDRFDNENVQWYYSPEIFGENYPKIISHLSNSNFRDRDEINIINEEIHSDQGLPQSYLARSHKSCLIKGIIGTGLALGCPLSFGGSSETFLFTPDIKNRYESIGRGDKFELIKLGIAHFQFASKLADPATGSLKLNPSVLLTKLLDKGKAGNASAIGTDYYPLVQKGLLGIEQLENGRFGFTLPLSKDKIADLEAIRDAFQSRTLMPSLSLDATKFDGNIDFGNSINTRSKYSIDAKQMTTDVLKEVFLA